MRSRHVEHHRRRPPPLRHLSRQAGRRVCEARSNGSTPCAARNSLSSMSSISSPCGPGRAACTRRSLPSTPEGTCPHWPPRARTRHRASRSLRARGATRPPLHVLRRPQAQPYRRGCSTHRSHRHVRWHHRRGLLRGDLDATHGRGRDRNLCVPRARSHGLAGAGRHLPASSYGLARAGRTPPARSHGLARAGRDPLCRATVRSPGRRVRTIGRSRTCYHVRRLAIAHGCRHWRPSPVTNRILCHTLRRASTRAPPCS